MNKLLLTFAVLLINLEVSAQSEPKKNDNDPKIEFHETEFSFGDIQEGEKIVHAFTFENSGIKPLFISGASTTCRCVVVEYPRKPVTKGKTGTIKVTFNSTGKIGIQNKIISIESNAINSVEKIKMKGKVLSAK